MRASNLVLLAVLATFTLLPSTGIGQAVDFERITQETAEFTDSESNLDRSPTPQRRGTTRWMPARILVRAIFGNAPGDRPRLKDELAEPLRAEVYDLPPIEFDGGELEVDEEVENAPDVDDEFIFEYDENLPDSFPPEEIADDHVNGDTAEQPASSRSEGADVDESAEDAELPPTPTGPLSTLPPSPDPFFGAVHKLLSAGDHQPLFPRHTLRPPTDPSTSGGKEMFVDAYGDLIALEELPVIANADMLRFTSVRAAADSHGKVVLLVDGRALLLEIDDWQDGTVFAQMPPLAISKPKVARVYMSDAGGVVIDAADFVMLPPLQD